MDFLASRQSRERRNVDTEDAVLVHGGSERRVKGMDTFHEEDIPVSEAHAAAFVHDGLAFLEIILGDDDFLACEQVVEVGVEHVDVHRSERFEIVFALFVLRGLVARHEIVVQLDDLRAEPEDAALLRDAQRR